MPEDIASEKAQARAVNKESDVLSQARDWLASGTPFALATVVETWGSSPRPAGSQLVVDRDGHFVGSVSGGCVEGAVIETALAVIESGAAQQLKFGVTDEQAWEVGLACGGRIEVRVESGDEIVSALAEDRDLRRPAVVLSWFDRNQQKLVHSPDALDDPVLCDAVRDALASDVARRVDVASGSVFVNPFNPPLRMLIVGAVHIAQELVPMAQRAGYEVTLIDPRAAFASQARFPGVQLVHKWPDAAIEAAAPDARTAIITLTHDPKLDEPALERALRSQVFYIGSLGSRRTHAKRLDRLRALGIQAAELDRIHAPVGLDIGARSPAEIAVSILAQVTQELRKRGR
jgi:xanthine dehydrogenase accessory factor